MSKKTGSESALRDEQAATFHRLRRLQEHSRSNIPAMMMQRSMSTFTLQTEPVPDELMGDVSIVVYPQDPFVGEPAVRQVDANDIRPGLVNSRVRIQDSGGGVAQPDTEGNYMYWPGTKEFDQVNSFYYTTFTLRMYERYARRSIPWSFPTPRIMVDPHVGNEANAFYNEQDRLLGFHYFEAQGEAVSTATSADIVSHEAAHAILDGLRDLYNESFGLGPASFHESFGDMSAVLVALHDDSLVRRLLEWTKGDLRMDSFITAIAEQMTASLRESGMSAPERTVYLRNALNDLKAIPFDELPYVPDNPEMELGRQVHNYSRLFTGAFYDILAGIYEKLSQDMPSHLAVHRARDMVGYMLVSAIELGPVGEFDFSDMARAFLAADAVLYDGRHHGILTEVFGERRILSPAAAADYLKELKDLPNIGLPEALNSALTSALFLEQKVIPALKLPEDIELIPMGAYRNTAGHAT